jgi:hypothetical protein
VYGRQAVVISVDPKTVYVVGPEDIDPQAIADDFDSSGDEVSGLQVHQVHELAHFYTITECCLTLSALGS